jgi:hypothetical protein
MSFQPFVLSTFWRGLALDLRGSSTITLDVRLGAAAVEIVIFKRFVVFSIPYEEIAAVETVSFVEAVFSFSLGLVNRPLGRLLLLHRSEACFEEFWCHQAAQMNSVLR